MRERPPCALTASASNQGEPRVPPAASASGSATNQPAKPSGSRSEIASDCFAPQISPESPLETGMSCPTDRANFPVDITGANVKKVYFEAGTVQI